MFTNLFLSLFTTVTFSARTDTVINVSPDVRLNVNNFGGDIEVAGWDRNAVHVAADHSPRSRVLIVRSGPNLEVRAVGRSGIPARVDYRIDVPKKMALLLAAIYGDITVTGCECEISAQTVRGDVKVSGGDGYIKLGSVEGAVTAEKSRGRFELESVNDAVIVSDVQGDVAVDAVNGDITLDKVQSDRVEASTVNGSVRFLGKMRDKGSYSFSTHSGDLELGVPDDANATVSVSTFNGDFQSAFPVEVERTHHGKRFNFALGAGTARVELESFEGSIQIRRALEMAEEMKQQTREETVDRQREAEKTKVKTKESKHRE